MNEESDTSPSNPTADYVRRTVETLRITHGAEISTVYQEDIRDLQDLLKDVEPDLVKAIIVGKTNALFPQITLEIIKNVAAEIDSTQPLHCF